MATLHVTRRQLLILGLTSGLAGCNTLAWNRDRDRPAPPANGPKIARDPQAGDLVAYLNENARRVQAVQTSKVLIDCKANGESGSIDGLLACSKPRNFRLKGVLAGQPVVDIGSNDDEFWYWIRDAKPKPYLFHCSYQDMARGNVQLPFPFHPDMVVAALGIAEYDPSAKYEMRTTRDTYELIEATRSVQGQDVYKVTVFNRGAATANKPQVLAYLLKDRQGKDICTVSVLEAAGNRETGATLPERVKIIWHSDKAAERIEMTMKLYGLQPTTFTPDRVTALFSRKELAHLQGFDLARWAPDQPSGTASSMSIQRVGAPVR